MANVVHLVSSRRPVGTIGEAIEALGGVEAVADETTRSARQVLEWIERDEIPTGWGLRLYLWLTYMGYEPDLAGVFQLRADGEWVALPTRSVISTDDF